MVTLTKNDLSVFILLIKLSIVPLYHQNLTSQSWCNTYNNVDIICFGIFGKYNHQSPSGLLLKSAHHVDMYMYIKWNVCKDPPQEKKTRSTVLNPRKTKFYDFQVLTGALHTVYHESSALLKKYTRYFLTTRHIKWKQLQ